jgi:hypothetical protein
MACSQGRHISIVKSSFDWLGWGFSPGYRTALKMFFGSAARKARRGTEKGKLILSI